MTVILHISTSIMNCNEIQILLLMAQISALRTATKCNGDPKNQNEDLVLSVMGTRINEYPERRIFVKLSGKSDSFKMFFSTIT